MIDPFLVEMGMDELHKRILANIKTLATIQKRSRMGPFPGIATWIADIAGPVYERYHDRELRESLRAKITKLQKEGDLGKIVSVLDDNDIKQADFLSFKKAMQEYNDLRNEETELTRKMEKPEHFGRDTGQEVAAVVSGVLAGIVVLAFAFLHFSRAGLL